MGKLDFLKKAAGAAKAKGGDAFGALKNKFPTGSIFGKKVETQVADKTPFEVGLGGTILDKGGRTPEKKEEKPSILGGIKEGLGKVAPKYKCRKCGKEFITRKGSGLEKERLCPICYQQYTAQLPKEGGKTESTSSSEQKEETIEKENVGSKRIGFNTSNIGKKIGGIITLGLVMAGTNFGVVPIYFPQFRQPALILSGIIIAFAAISMFVKNAGGYLAVGCVGVLAFTSWQFGYLQPVADKYGPTFVDFIGNAGVFVNVMVTRAACIFGDPANFNACMKAVTQNTTESVNKLGPYETVEFKLGTRLDGTYDYDLPESGQDYTLAVTFTNKNTAVYEINFTQVNAYTTIKDTNDQTHEIETGIKSAFDKYTLDPKEELPIRFKEFDLPDDWNCLGSQTFEVNATTEQKSGGWSDFGIAPSDLDNYRKFVHGFNPNINAEPGPLNIYVYTDPWGISAADFKEPIADASDRAEVIIKIQNKVKSGTAKINDLYLVQEFEVPDKLFNIITGSCEGTRGLVQPSNLTVVSDPSGVCSSNWKNCLYFTFPNTLTLKPNEKVTISCKIETIKEPPQSNEYTDQIRVYANFQYTQEWTNSIPCLTVV